MKLKYYLRGLGMGILFATIVMTVSSVVHNNNLSEETIIKEAKKLGMIMPETDDESKGGLWGKKEDNTEETTETQIQDTEVKSSEVQDSEAESSEVNNSETQSTEPESTEPESSEKKEPVVIQNGNITLIEISVYPGDNARQVAERLYENGLVENSESFRLYLGESGYAKLLAVGEYYIPVGATYEEIVNILMRK